MAATTTSLFDTRDRYDAHLLGYDETCDPREDGEGLIVEIEVTAPNPFSCPSGWRAVSIVTAEGSVELDADVIIRIADMLRPQAVRVAA